MSDSSRPPHDPRATHHDGDETLEERVSRYRGDERETFAMVVSLSDRLGPVEELVGRAPSALPGDRGSGLAQHLVDLTMAMAALRDAFTTGMTALRESIETERRARIEEAAKLAANKAEEAAKLAAAKTEEEARALAAKTAEAARREPWSRVAWLTLGALITAVITVVTVAIAGGAFNWIATLHH